MCTYVDIARMRLYVHIVQIRTARELGAAVKGRRRELGWTQEQLATAVGVSRRWVIAAEQGKPGIELTLVIRTVNTLGLAIDVIQAPIARGAVDLDEVLRNHGRR